MPPNFLLQALTPTSTLSDNDLFYVVTDPSGTPADHKITKANTSLALLNGLTVTVTSSTLTVASGKTLTFNDSMTFTGAGTLVIGAGKTTTFNSSTNFSATDGTSMTFPTTSAAIARTDAAQTFIGTQTFSGTIIGIINSSSTFDNSNLVIASATGLSGTRSTAQLEINGNPTQFRVGIRGSLSTVATAGNDVWALLIGNNTFTEAVSGTSALAGGLGIVTQTFTGGVGATTDFQNLYVGDAPTGATNNWSINAGASKFRAQLTLAAGTATAGTAPLKIPTGTLLSVTEAGALEQDGTHIYFTFANAGTRYQLDQQTPAGVVTSVSGTSNRITSTGGTTPVIDISASYVGQSSITTLGTIVTGVWNGTAIANANLANSTISGIALGGTLGALTATNATLTFSGSYDGSTARTIGINLSNANTWAALQTFGTNISIGGVTATGATGTGNSVFDNTPTLITPVLGVATATSINKVAITAPASSATLAIADGKTLTYSNSITMAGTDATVMTFPTTTATIARTDAAQTFTGTQTFSIAPVFASGILTSSTFDNNNLTVASSTGLSGTRSTAQLEINSNPVQLRALIRGSTSTVATAGNDVWALLVGNNTYTEAVSGTSALAGGVGIVTQTFTGGVGATTDFQNLYVGDAPTGAVNNWAINAGASQFRGNVTVALGSSLLFPEGSNGRVGQVALVAGTKAITISGLTTSSRAFVTLVTPNTTAATITYQAVCTANTLTLQANIAAGTINVADISTLNYLVIN